MQKSNTLNIFGFICLIAVIITAISSCRHKSMSSNTQNVPMVDSLRPSYSSNFEVNYYADYKVIKVYEHIHHQLSGTYILHKKGVKLAASILIGAVEIETPVSKIVCMSTTHIGALSILNARNVIVAATNKDLIYDSMVRMMMANAMIKDAGKDYQPDYEVIAQTKPDLLFSDGENNGSSQMMAKLKSLGIKVVSSRDYFEQDPLARAEWLKFFAAFIDREQLADSIFKDVSQAYQRTDNTREKRAMVFCNLPYNGIWYMPCGKNYNAKMITDAGGNFLWNDEVPVNGLNLTLTFEQVYQRAARADVWINTGTYTSISQIIAQDAKFKLFKPYKTGRIYNGTKRISAGGGLDIWETGAFRPDLIKKDLSLIFHSTAVPDGQLYYYQQIK